MPDLEDICIYESSRGFEVAEYDSIHRIGLASSLEKAYWLVKKELDSSDDFLWNPDIWYISESGNASNISGEFYRWERVN